MKKIILNIAMSIDGYIAREDHRVDWINGDGSEPNTTLTDMGFNYFLHDIQSIIMGRKSYEVTKSFAPLRQQFPGKDITVITTKKIEDHDIKTSQLSIKEVIKTMNDPIWLFGGSKLVKSFMEKDLVTDLELSIIPITLGKGIRLFTEIDKEIKWEFLSQKVYNGISILKYKRRKND